MNGEDSNWLISAVDGDLTSSPFISEVEMIPEPQVFHKKVVELRKHFRDPMNLKNRKSITFKVFLLWNFHEKINFL